MTQNCKLDQEKPVEDAKPKLFCYQAPFIYAFPTNLAIVETAAFEYDCTPWLVEPLHDDILLWRMVDFARPYRRKGESATPRVRFGTSTDVHFYAVFPHLETIGMTAECRIFKKWHDDVVLPAFGEALKAAGHTYPEEYPPAHE